MLFTAKKILNDEVQYIKGKWSIAIDIHYSIESLRFLNQTVMINPGHRSYLDQLVEHHYLKCNLKDLTSHNERLLDIIK